MDIKIKYFNTNSNFRLKKIQVGDWIDLFAFIGNKEGYMEYRSGEQVLIPLGVAMEIPKGYEAHILPRSSTFKNFGLIMTNSMGVVDNSYCGDNDQWMFSAYAFKDGMIREGDRICQFRIFQNQPDLNFVEVEKLEGKDRGGFGSTGTR